MTHAFFRALLSITALFLAGVVIYYGILSDAPLPDRQWLHGKNDLALHALAFFALSLPMLTLWPRLMTVITLAGLAAAVEVAQFWLPRRTSALDDILAGVAGVAVGVALVWGVHRFIGLRADRRPRDGAKSNAK